MKDADWADTVRISENAASFRFRSNGLPNHAIAKAYLVPLGLAQPFKDFEIKLSQGFVTSNPIDVTIPLTPVNSETMTPTSLGMIGVMISGVRLFNDYENPERSIVAMDDQHVLGVVGFLD